MDITKAQELEQKLLEAGFKRTEAGYLLETGSKEPHSLNKLIEVYDLLLGTEEKKRDLMFARYLADSLEACKISMQLQVDLFKSEMDKLETTRPAPPDPIKGIIGAGLLAGFVVFGLSLVVKACRSGV